MKSVKPLHSVLLTSLGVSLLLGSINLVVATEPAKISESALQQIRALEQEKLSRSPQHRKLDSQFVFKLKQKRNQPIAPGVTKLQPDLQIEADGRVLVDIEANVSESLLAQIMQSGGTVISSVPQFHAVRALMTLEQAEDLASRADVKFIRRAAKAQTNTGNFDTEGDVTHRADFARSTFGTTGQGVKVGVLSDSAINLSYSQANGDLGDVTVLPGQAGYGADEGRAMLEIIHDLAPGAQLFFATAVNSEASFAQNILNLRSNGCDIIVDDIGYVDESPFQDGVIAQAVNSVTASGALYFSAAGNQGNQKNHTSCTWEGDFVDGGPAGPPVNAGGGRIMSFGATPYNTVLSYASVNLFWSDPLGASTNDYDLFLLDPTGSYVYASSLNLQDGTQDPYESLYNGYAGYRIVIVKTSGEARFLHLEAPTGNRGTGTLSISTVGATRGHSAAAAAFSVAAVNAANIYPNPFTPGNQNPVEVFCSDGPRRVFFNPDGTAITPGNFSSNGGAVRQKPDLAAADGVRTSLGYPFSPFFGTSAAAPHAAGIAALLLSYNHGLSPSQIRNTLTSTALDIESPGVDVNSGAGIVMADAALLALPPRPVISAAGSALVTENCPNGVVDVGESVTVALFLANSGLADTTNLVATLVGTGGITALGGPQNYGTVAAHGNAVSRTFSFTGGGTCGVTNVATLRLQDGANDLGTVSFSFPLGNPRVPLAENFDGVTPPALPTGWTAFRTGAGTGWATINGYPIDTPPNSVNVVELSSTSDNLLTTPSLPIVTSSAQLSFRHFINTYYYGYNGGVLEISTNAGAFTDILAAGGSFATNGYYATLYSGYGNPIEGRQAWTGYSGFITTVVNLPAAAAGQNVQLRWRFATGNYYGYGSGWTLDNITVRDGFACCAPTPNDLVVSMSDLPDPVVLGGSLTYTIHVLNTGPSAATGVTLTDVLPDTFDLQSISVTPGVTPGPQANGGGTLLFNLGTLAAGGSANITIVGAANSVGSMTNRVTVGRAEADVNTNNNAATTVTSVIPPALSINDVTLFDGSSSLTNANFTVSLSPPPFQSVTVEFSTADISARAGTDYLSAHGTLTFAPGVTNRTITVPVIGTTLNQPTRLFAVNLSNPVGASLGRNQGLGTIFNDDPLPTLSVADATLVVPTAGTTNAVFNFRLNVPSGQTVSFNYYTSDGTALGSSDYLPTSGYVYFEPGQTNQTVTVTVNAHITRKPSQTFNLNLSGPYNVKLSRNHGLATVLTAFPGQLDHLGWGAISSPQSNGTPFSVTITALDYWNSTVSNFSDQVTLSGDGVSGTRTNNMLGNATHSDYYSTGPYTWANAFTPNTNLVVTHVRHYFGTKVSIWTDAGVLLASQNVASVPGTWVETPLSTPLQLLAGQTYRVSVYYPGGNGYYYGRYDQSSTFADGTINQGYYGYGDAFPYYYSSWRWIFVDLRYTAASVVPVSVTPGNSDHFTNGIWSSNITLGQPATNVTLRADDGAGHVGLSLPFDVLPAPGQATHFVWSPIASPQTNGAPFPITITAQDYFNVVATNFTGTVALSGLPTGATTNTMFGNIIPFSSGSGYYTLGNAFTPNRNITVTHVRHYFGSKVSLWTDAGVLLASQDSGGTNVAPGSWVETALPTPVPLSAGQTYRVAVYTAGNTYFLRNDQSTVFSDGTINQGYETGGDGFPYYADSARWWAVDIRYTVGAAVSVLVSPTNSANFSNGVFSGSATVGPSTTNVTLRADDGAGHFGLSLPFDVRPSPGQVTQLAWSTIPSPQSNGVPFPVTITAKDYYNGLATSFTGTVALSGTGFYGLTRTNTILDSPYPYNSGFDTITLGYSFTPRTNMTVTHVRHFFGTRVSIWTDAGNLLAARNFTRADGTWGDASIPPLQLQEGKHYRIGVYTGPNSIYYYRNDLPASFPDGSIDQSYQAPGASFPTNSDFAQWWLVDLKYTVDFPGPVQVAPTSSDYFNAAVWTGNMAILQAATNVTLRADDGAGHVSQSLPFNVLPATPVPGQVTHFSWAPIASPQSNSVPFPVTITAQDYLNNAATNFTGTVALSAAGPGPSTNDILGNLPSSASSSGDFTLSYAFTPNANLVVTHVRHYSGTKVSIWKDDGTLLASQPVISTPQTWLETPLSAPVSLAAGVTYRVGYYSANSTYYWNSSAPSSFANGTLMSGYYYSYGDAFPTNFQGGNRTIYLVDLRYSLAFSTPVSANPSRSDHFASGVWTGNVAIGQGAKSVILGADDGLGHFGLSQPFNMASAPSILIQPQRLTNYLSGTAQFSVAADGTPPLSYQWMFNDTNPVLLGTSATLTLTNLQYANAGNYKVVVTNTYGSAVSSNALLAVQPVPGPLLLDLNTNQPNLLTVFGSAFWTPYGGVTNSGYISLTDNYYNQHGAVVFNELLPGVPIRSFRVSMDVRIGGGTTPPADGLSVNFARLGDSVLTDGSSFLPTADGSDSASAEEGTRTGLSVMLDTWQNGPTDVIGIGVRVDSVLLAQYPRPTLNGAANDPSSLQTGPDYYDLAWVPLVITLYEDGTLQISYKGVSVTPPGGLQTHFTPGRGQFVLGGRTGGSYEVHHVDNLYFAVNFPGSPATTVDHFALSQVPSPQFTNVPFQVTIQAQNAVNTVVTNFNGTVILSAITNLGGGGYQANFETGLQSFTADNAYGNGNGLWHRSSGRGSQAGHSASSSIYYGNGEGTGGGGTYNTTNASGYPTPNEGVITSPVIDLRNVTNPPTLSFNYLIQSEPGSDWDEATVEISADGGNTFDVVAGINEGGIRLTNDTGGSWRSAAINLSNYVGSQILVRFHFNTVDSYANNYEGWYVDDILVNAPLAGPIAVFPASTGNFTNGTWTGNLSIPQGASSVTLLTDDGNNHTGTGNSFSVLAVTLVNDLSLAMSAPAGPVPVGANLTYSLTVSNRGPAVANGVTVSNFLPAGVSFVSAALSQGSSSQANGVVRCSLGTLPGATSATVTIVAVPGIAGTTVTNFASLSRSEVDPYLGNNSASVATIIGPPAISVADSSVLGNILGQTNILFPITLSAPSAQPITISYSTADGTAIGGADYDSSVPAPVTFNAGVATQNISVVVYPHISVKPSQTFYVRLNSPTNASLTRTQAVGTIVTARPGYADYFVWSGIASPQLVGGPFAVTLAAQDYLNNPATNFAGPANLSASYSQVAVTNILGTPPLSTSTDIGNWTLGYAFTPNTYINVTHVRHYFGTKVSIWTDAGLLLLSQNVSSVPGTWVETPLASPILLAPGTRYRVAAYSAGGSYYWRTGMPGTFAFGTIDQGYGYPGDGFPSGANLTKWAYVDLRYSATGTITVPISPSSSGNFAGGFWSGTIASLQAATNVVLKADDGLGHSGLSQPFNVISAQVPPVMITVQYSSNQVLLTWPGGILQSATQATGPYSDITGANSPYSLSPSGPRQFFRVRVK